jgi:hypothetical protein
VTQTNKDNLTNAASKMEDAKLRNMFLANINSVKLNELEATLEYYLKDLNDKNRFQTAWMYATEYIKDNTKREIM